MPRPLTAVLGLSFIAGAAWYALTLLGATPVVYAIPWAVHAAVGWMILNVALVWLAIRRVRATQYASERRSSVRFATNLPGRLDGIEVWVRDLSLTGARIAMPGLRSIAPLRRLVVDAANGPPIELDGTIRATWTDADGHTMVGFEFDTTSSTSAPGSP